MPTYADIWNEEQRALGQSGPSNPVRLTISKGDYVWDPQTSRFRYEEQWEEEHLMEDEELLDNTYATASPSNSGTLNSRESSLPSLAALQPTALHGHSSVLEHHPSLWVLDTNTLMSCLELLKALFASLLTHNVAYAGAIKGQQHVQSSASPTRPSSIKLVLPHVVVSELDGLKVTRRKDDSGRPVASQAREANHWLLSALQKQKRVTIDQADTPLSQDLWPLFVQPSSHYNRSNRSSGGRSNWTFDEPDDEIVRFCVDLKQQTSSHVRFCSDDTNARTKAERDGIDSLGMGELANALKLGFKDVQSAEQKWMHVADALIEQWEYQIGTTDSIIQHEGQHPLQQQQGGTDVHLLQAASQVAGTASYAPTLNGSTHQGTTRHHGLSASNDGIVKVDMDTEEQQEPSNDASSVPLATLNPYVANQRASPSYDGRSTNDSIHSPQNRQAARTRSARPPPTSSRPSLTAAQGPAMANEHPEHSQALNPQIEWQDLMQQYGSSSRMSNRQRNGRW
ncbi:uncharacterized protein SPSC_01492 [Sporisorium scitamineum]|uniref:PIN domain-containing protein n=1 Tax=Sporisorium scitamineum TaxID=49012 RepID=A0A0F7S4C0_9BASI|nr:hypothetical protein [Sporisorium scitamineum]CDU22862.1 uncharacterized protein SPSC_01492 [Sporisorium scitamineum]